MKTSIVAFFLLLAFSTSFAVQENQALFRHLSETVQGAQGAQDFQTLFPIGQDSAEENNSNANNRLPDLVRLVKRTYKTKYRKTAKTTAKPKTIETKAVITPGPQNTDTKANNDYITNERALTTSIKKPTTTELNGAYITTSTRRTSTRRTSTRKSSSKKKSTSKLKTSRNGTEVTQSGSYSGSNLAQYPTPISGIFWLFLPFLYSL
ncbi:uncharacterized protein ASCRUDRAFT_74395, partial [Ascoidea rubescens DSM 1968]